VPTMSSRTAATNNVPMLRSASEVSEGLPETTAVARPMPNSTRTSAGVRTSEKGGANANIGAIRKLRRRLEMSQPAREFASTTVSRDRVSS